ncbi:uncharacterized protein Dwil_GK13785 [Drosophila willistoni]|uniref:DEUBAD domain-containing protein n=1 Tax=Drosophila willistoni TaxID=7260 RepID=B4NIQ4_DROWI|nr:uncharacterized protein Dwil_GK13785 [Drosophila willistoni]
MSNNMNININRPSLDSLEEEGQADEEIEQLSDSSSSSKASSSTSHSSPGSNSVEDRQEPDVEIDDEDLSDEDSVTGSEDSDDDEDEDDDDDDDNTTCQSDELELAQLTERDIFRVPRGLCENSTIFHEFFSLETWQMLPLHMQARLQSFLPQFNPPLMPAAQASAEQQRTLVQLFNGGLQRFGKSPLIQLQRQLEEGNLRPDVRQLRRSIENSKRREHHFQQAERLSQLAKDLFLSREELLQHAYSSAPPSTDVNGWSAALKLPLVRSRKRKTPPTLPVENKYCLQRSKKRYTQELRSILQELKIQSTDLSADEEDGDSLELRRTMDDAKLIEPQDVANNTKASNAADKKCIYNTFFKRHSGADDELILRRMQADRIPQLNDRNFRKYLRDYKRRKLEQPDLADFDTTDIRLRDICTRAQFVGNFKPGRKPKALMARLNATPNPPALVPIGIPGTASSTGDEELLKDEPQTLYGRQAVEEHVVVDGHSPKLPKLEPLSGTVSGQIGHITGSPTVGQANPTAVPDTSHASGASAAPASASAPATAPSRPLSLPRPVCYFSLLRDLFVSTPQHRLTYGELQGLVTNWRDNSSNSHSNSATLEWMRHMPEWSMLLQSAVNFLAGDFPTLPVEYVPYIDYKSQLGIYQWIGAGRDLDARLISLCQFWLQRRKDDEKLNAKIRQSAIGSQSALSADSLPTPPPRCPTSWTVRTANQAEMLEFQRQERLRFEHPHRPFTYRLNGYESVVGPVKGIYTQSLPLNKARGHAVMVDDRPPYVTILTLVRDATARLPNGEGTRSEISELLKCSQYINKQAAENVLQTIVSGALDRLHGGLDPCVRYDARRKIWIYLHRNRGEAEFEKMHRHNQTLVKQQHHHHQLMVVKTTPNKKDEDGEALEAALPALVPAAVSQASPLMTIKKPLPVKTSPPVPPLKYHIPPPTAASQSHINPTQKSLLKPATGGAGVGTPTSAPGKLASNFAITKISPTRHTTPILVSTPTGLQTVHVATNANSANSPLTSSQQVASAAKKLTIKKSSAIGNFIIPLEQAHQQQQQQQQTKTVTISARQGTQLPKNFIRLLPTAAAGTGTGGAAAAAAQTKPTSVQILGHRVLPQQQQQQSPGTIRSLQQKIGAVSIMANKTITGTSVGVASGSGSGTIVRMSPQAFASLQQQQLKQKANASTSNTSNSAGQSPQQQRIIVGNTAISSNKSIVFQALPKTVPKILTTNSSSSGGTHKQPTANLSSQQQRIVLQNFKQPATASATTSSSQTNTNATRIIRTAATGNGTNQVTTAGAAPTGGGGGGGNIITLDSLIQKSNATATTGKLITSGSNIIQLAATSTTGNVITLTPNQNHNQVAKPRIVTTTGAGVGGGGGVVPKIIGKTTVLPGKPLLLQAKTLKHLGAGTPVNNQVVTTATPAKTTQSIVIGGQTVKLQGALPARAASGAMQTVIMGNQLLRLAPATPNSNSNPASATNSAASTNSLPSPTVTTPKTLLIGPGGAQTLRLGKNVLLANKLTSTGSSVPAGGTNNSTNTATATGGNNLVFAVQGNGGQLYFSHGLQGVNLKPLSGMKVIPMTSTASGAKAPGEGGGATVAIAGKTMTTKLLPAAVLKTTTTTTTSGNAN